MGILVAVLLAPFVAQLAGGGQQSVVQEMPIPSAFLSALESAFPDDRCTTAAGAVSEVGAQLEAAGYGGWTVDDSGVRRDECVTWSLRAPVTSRPGTIALSSALAPAVRNAMRGVRNETLDRCLGRQEAIDLVTTTLTVLGVDDFQVRTDGPLAIPNDREAEILRHVEDGCWLYSAVGWVDGQAVFFVSGKDGE